MSFNKQNETKTYVVRIKILRIICCPIYDNKLGCWHRRRNKEIRELGKAQIIKWFGHVMRRSGSKYLVVVEWKLTGDRPRGRPKKGWIIGIEQDSEKLGLPNWEEKYKIEKSGRRCPMAEKTLEEL